MDIDKARWWQVQPPSGRRSRRYDNEADARGLLAETGGKLTTGTTWIVRYRDPDGAQRSRSFDRKPDAERFATTTHADIVRGQWIDPKAGRRTFKAYAEEWRTIQIHQPGTATKVEGDLRRHVYPVIGDVELGRVRYTHIQAWARGVTGKLAPSTIEVIYTWIASVFVAAIADGLIGRTPCVGITLPEVEKTKIVPWTLDMVTALADAHPARYRALVWHMAGSGVRQGEAFAADLSQLHMLERSLDVDWQAQPAAGGGVVWCRPKTKASRRTIPLGDISLEHMAAHLAEFPATEVELRRRERDGTITTGVERVVFTNKAGRPLRRSYFNEHIWRPAVETAKLPEGSHCHELRHFYASALIRHGESPKVVQERLGHASITETMDTYGHLWPDADDQTRQAIDEALRPPVADDEEGSG